MRSSIPALNVPSPKPRPSLVGSPAPPAAKAAVVLASSTQSVTAPVIIAFFIQKPPLIYFIKFDLDDKFMINGGFDEVLMKNIF
jgi:hypothetical protein